MKRYFYLFVLLVCVMAASAQSLFQQDKNVRTGTLPNGLTYYIRHNEEPKDRAYFYIAQKVGSILERPDQRGLAHFLEHMAFNGTKNFPETSLRTYLERIGVKFGADLNAYTAVDETVYNIDNVPTTVKGSVDSCLLILHDWSHNLTLADKDIDDERGVIHEEWRQRNTASQRMNEKMMPVIMAGSKYADCMPIGSMDIVMNFKPQTLRDYYAKWYRPDLQGIVVVGDIDINQVEQKIRKVFSDIKAPGKNAAKRIYYPVPDNKEPIVFIGTDKELGEPSVTFYWKTDATPRERKNTREYMIDNMYASFLYSMFHDRTRDIAQTPDAPFSLGYVKYGNYYLSNTKNALMGTVSCHNGKNGIEKGMKAFLREIFRVRQHGFTETEFDRYRKDMLSSLDKMEKEKDKRQSSTFVSEYVRNFLDGEPIPSLDDEISFWRQALPQMSAAGMNKWFNSIFKADGSDIVITLTGEKTDSIPFPTKEQLIGYYKDVAKEQQAPYVDNVSRLPLLPVDPTPGTIVSETKDAKGRTVMTLSNGAKVIVMPTSFKKDEILVQSLSHGGYSLWNANDYRFGTTLSMINAVSGQGNWTLSDMQKNMAGINASVTAGVADSYQSAAGSCAPKDLRWLMQLIYAAHRYPNKDANAAKALLQRLEKSTRESEGKPQAVYGDSITKTFYGDNPYAKDIKAEKYKTVDLDHMLELYRKSFSDGGSFTYTVIGNVNIDSLRPLVCKYLASQPATHADAKARPVLNYMPGSRTCIFTKAQETPKASLYIKYIAPCKFDLKNQITASILGQVLTIKYTQTIREEAGAAYSPNAGCTVKYYPAEQAELTVRFPTSPESLQRVRILVSKGLDEIIKNGPSKADVDKAIEYLRKVHQSNRTVNQYWQYVLSYEWNHGIDLDGTYDATLDSITVKDIQNMAHILKKGQRLECDMTTK